MSAPPVSTPVLDEPDECPEGCIRHTVPVCPQIPGSENPGCIYLHRDSLTQDPHDLAKRERIAMLRTAKMVLDDPLRVFISKRLNSPQKLGRVMTGLPSQLHFDPAQDPCDMPPGHCFALYFDEKNVLYEWRVVKSGKEPDVPAEYEGQSGLEIWRKDD